MTEIDLTNLNEVTKLIQEIESSQFRHRQRAEYAGFEIMSGKLYEYVLNTLVKKRPITWEGYTVSAVNYMSKIVSKKAQAYEQEPKRQVMNETGEVDEQKTDELNRIYSEGKFNDAFVELDQIYNRARHTLAWVQNDPEDLGEFDQYRMVPLQPYTFNVLIDPDTLKLRAVVLSYPDTTITHDNTKMFSDEQFVDRADGQNQTLAEGDNRDSGAIQKTYAFWTDDQHVRVRAELNIIGDNVKTVVAYDQPKGNDSGVNPYGILPFVWVTAMPSIPERPPLQPLYRESINMNMMRSEELTGASIASTGILKMKIAKGDKPEDITVGHTLVLTIEQPMDPDAPEVDADFISPSPNLQQVSQTFKEYAEDIAAEQGLSGFSMTDSNNKFNSGFERALAMADITEVRKKNQKKYRYVEADVFEIVKAMDAVNGQNQFSVDDKLSVEYKKPEIIQSEMEQLQIIEKKDSMGMLRERDKFIELKPNLDETEAQALVDEIAEEKQNKLLQMQQFLAQNMPENEVDIANQQETINQENQTE
jgi:hypothetical protein